MAPFKSDYSVCVCMSMYIDIEVFPYDFITSIRYMVRIKCIWSIMGDGRWPQLS